VALFPKEADNLVGRSVFCSISKDDVGALQMSLSYPVAVAAAGAASQRIARAIGWLKTHFTASLQVEALARQVGMSPSAFHLHFKWMTALSPLKYQKRLGLQESSPADAGRSARSGRGIVPPRLRESVAVWWGVRTDVR
jgi:hypothetical protein